MTANPQVIPSAASTTTGGSGSSSASSVVDPHDYRSVATSTRTLASSDTITAPPPSSSEILLPSSSSFVPSTTSTTTTGPRRAFTRYPNSQGPTILIPQPLSPIGLHHVLDLSSTTSASSAGSAQEASRPLHTYTDSSPSTTHSHSRQYHQPRPLHPQHQSEILPHHQTTNDTLAQSSSAPSSTPTVVIPPPSSTSAAQHARRIMTPTSRLAETAVSVREVSKKIGRARVKWETPKTVMIVTKPGDDTLLKITRQIALWMIVNRGLKVYVDEKLKDQPRFRYPKFLKDASTETVDYTQQLSFWTADLCAQEAHLFDFAITLGGDGTVLFTSWLFQRIVPPILPFSAGSLGFLTPFPTSDYQRIISNSLDQGVRVSLRMRFSCTIYRCLEHRAAEKEKKSKNSKSKKGKNKSPSSLSRRATNGSAGKGRRGDRRSKIPTQDHLGSSGPSDTEDSDDEDSDGHESEFRKRSLPTVLTTPTETFEILNDLVLDRGPSANLSLLELFGDEEHLTTVQADGIVISTPTGSTAYSLAAGGPLTHPDIPAILISPICPHTLSFRPMLLPDSMELRICVPFDSRSTAWASFDGRGRVELKQGDHIKVTASVYPFPTICSSTQSSDWFHSLSRCLRWNERQRQKGFRVVEHSRPRRTRQQSTSMMNNSASAAAQSSSSFSVPQNNRDGTHGSDSPGSNADGLQSAGNSSQNDSQPSSGKTPSQRKRQINIERQQQASNMVASPLTATPPANNPLQANGSSTAAKTRATRSSQPSPAPLQPGGRKGNRYDIPDEYDSSFQHTETMLTCWGTDYHDTDYDDDDDDDEPGRKGSQEDEERAEEGDAEWEDGCATSDDSDVEPSPSLVHNGLATTSSSEIVTAAVAPLNGAIRPHLPPPLGNTDGVARLSNVAIPPALNSNTTTTPELVQVHTSSAPATSAHPSTPTSTIPTQVAISASSTVVAGRVCTPSTTPVTTSLSKDLEDHLRIPKSTSPVSDGCISFDDVSSTVGLPPVSVTQRTLATSAVVPGENHGQILDSSFHPSF